MAERREITVAGRVIHSEELRFIFSGLNGNLGPDRMAKILCYKQRNGRNLRYSIMGVLVRHGLRVR